MIRKQRFILGGMLLLAPLAGFGAEASKVLVVNTDEQKVYAWEDDKLIYEFHVVTGRPGKETTAGRFETLPVGSPLPSDTDCAAAVRPTSENRPDNATANATPGRSTWWIVPLRS